MEFTGEELVAAIRRSTPFPTCWLPRCENYRDTDTSRPDLPWQDTTAFTTKIMRLLMDAQFRRIPSARDLVERLLLAVPELLQEPPISGSKGVIVSNCGIVFLYRRQADASGVFVDDVLVQHSADPTLHNPSTLEWIASRKGEGEELEDWTPRDLLLEEAACSFHSIPDGITLQVNKSELFDELKHIFDSGTEGEFRAGENRSGYALPFESRNPDLAGVFFVILEYVNNRCLPGLAAAMRVIIQAIEAAVGTETEILTNKVVSMGLSSTSRWDEATRIDCLIDLMYAEWKPEEITLARRSGPFVIVDGSGTRRFGEKLDVLTHKKFLDYYHIWSTSVDPRQRSKRMNGYCASAVAEKTAYYVPFIHSRVPREHGAVPRSRFDASISKECFDGLVRSQYTTSYAHAFGFDGVVNLGFFKRCGLWTHQRQVLAVLLETLAEYMYRFKWDESEYSVMSNACKALAAVSVECDRLRNASDASDAHLHWSALNRMLDKLSHQFISNRTGGIPSRIPANPVVEKNIRRRCADPTLSKRAAEIMFDVEVEQDCTVRMLSDELHVILDNLIENAMEAQGTSRIRVTMRKTQWPKSWGVGKVDGVELVIADDGAAVSKVIEHRMFDRGETDKSGERANLGKGLWVVDQICRDYRLLLEYRPKVEEPYSKEFAVFFPEDDEVR